jgi:hypothetical protein
MLLENTCFLERLVIIYFCLVYQHSIQVEACDLE